MQPRRASPTPFDGVLDTLVLILGDTNCSPSRSPTRLTRATPAARRVEVERLPVEGGLPAPDFTLTADDGSTVTLSCTRGRPVVLFFYPKDDSRVCQ